MGLQTPQQQNSNALEKKMLTDGQALFRTGDPATRVFLIASGEIGLYREDAEGNRTEIFTLKSGEFVGISAMLPDQKHKSTARAKGQAVVVPISSEQLQAQYGRMDKLGQNLMAYVISRLGQLLEKQG